MRTYRNNYPKQIGNRKVVKVLDYFESTEYCIASNTHSEIHLPKSNVIQYILDDETKMTMRPSGTEPKIKFYFSVKTILESKEFYAEAIESLENTLSMIVEDMNLSNK